MLSGEERRSFQAAIALKYCEGNARQAERVFGWGRETVQLGLPEHRTGILCLGAPAAFGGKRLWEEQHPEVAQARWALAESHSQQAPTFRTRRQSTRLTATEAVAQLRAQGFPEESLPSPSTMAEVLNRNGYRLHKVIKAKPPKIPETDAIFVNLAERDGKPHAEPESDPAGPIKRLSRDCKAPVKRGDYARGGKTRGDYRAADHEMGGTEKYVPGGLVEENSGQLYLTFGSSSKTSDFMVDRWYDWWNETPMAERTPITHLHLKIDHGPESRGVRTQFLKRMVDFADHTGKPIQLLYYPPYHSKYHPIERCGGILEQHGNGTKLVDVDPMLSWAHSMTWKGIHPIVKLSQTVYQKGGSLSKKAMRAVEARWERNPLLPQWDILIRPA